MIYFAGWKKHYSLYPATAELVAAFKDELAPYELSKGTIRFPLSRPVPVRLIGRIARFRAANTAERAEAKLAASNKRRHAVAGQFESVDFDYGETVRRSTTIDAIQQREETPARSGPSS